MWKVKIDRTKWGDEVCVWMMLLLHSSYLPPTCHSVFSFLSSRFYIYIKLNTFLSIRNEHFHFLNYACWWHSISLCSLSLHGTNPWETDGVTFDITFHFASVLEVSMNLWRRIRDISSSCRQTFTLNSSRKTFFSLSTEQLDDISTAELAFRWSLQNLSLVLVGSGENKGNIL